ncbi:unnamed protein product [Brassica rapa]|uniref:Uncharacterized protein n=2 Tax=Brassica TaxID=3705 RepID=A0A8D9M5H7_BRACM|nr:unnamed protein product [Brassica napus]CAG7899138.1 unnamed protein product [Brassica rapa]
MYHQQPRLPFYDKHIGKLLLYQKSCSYAILFEKCGQ